MTVLKRSRTSGVRGVYRVYLTEHERGWGASTFAHRDFPTQEEADKYMRAENAKNNAPYAPDYYIQADEPRFVESGSKCECWPSCK